MPILRRLDAIRSAEGLDAVRAALRRLFDQVTLVRDPFLGTYEVEPSIRPDAIVGCVADTPLGRTWPRPQRTSLPVAASGNNQSDSTVAEW